MKKLRICFILCIILLGLTACGHPAKPAKLAREAKNLYGDAKMVNKVKTPIGYSVTMYDELQGFNYTMSSSLDQIGLFNARPVITSDFTISLVRKITYDEQMAIEDIEYKYDANLTVSSETVYVYSENPDNAKQAALEIADILQMNNLEGRLNGVEIRVNTLGTYMAARTGRKPETDEKVGTVTLPNKDWHSKEQDLINYYTILAKEYDPDAVFLRKEETKLRYTGFDLEDIGGSNGAPEFLDSPVTFYYFKASDGGEFYIGDFCLYEEDRTVLNEVTNYENRKYPDD